MKNRENSKKTFVDVKTVVSRLNPTTKSKKEYRRKKMREEKNKEWNNTNTKQTDGWIPNYFGCQAHLSPSSVPSSPLSCVSFQQAYTYFYTLTREICTIRRDRAQQSEEPPRHHWDKWKVRKYDFEWNISKDKTNETISLYFIGHCGVSLS